jgi:HSP20 family protein
MTYTFYKYDYNTPHPDTARANILSNDKGMTIELEAPGFSRSDITVETKGSTLTVTAKRTDAPEEKYRIQEFNAHHLTRSWTLPKSIDVDKIVAAYDAGILTLTMPYRSDSVFETRRIEIA